MLIILFGLTGSGKNFVGEVIAQHFNFHFWDADEVLLKEMKQYIQQKKPFSQRMRDKFTQEVINTILKLQSTHQNLVVSQALYKEINRVQIYTIFPQAKFIWVQAESKNILDRLKTRNNWVNKEYAKKISLEFEIPHLPYVPLENNDKQALISQIVRILK